MYHRDGERRLIEASREMTTVRGNRVVGGSKKAFVPKGHDRQLADMQENGKSVSVYLMAGGEALVGKIVRKDKFTITILTQRADGNVNWQEERLLFKHAIEQIVVTTQVQ